MILDEIPDRNDLRCLKTTVAYHKRALPIWSACYAPGGQPRLGLRLLDRDGHFPLFPASGRAPSQER